MSITLELVKPSVEMLRDELERRWGVDKDRLDEICRHALLPPGKLLRPLLLMESAAAIGGDRFKVLPAALAVEYLHSASLIHDDIIDNDRMRRGRASVMAQYGIADAIVAGDALFLMSTTALAECGERGVLPAAVVTALRLFGDSGVLLCRGEVEEGTQRGMLDAGVSAYLEVIGLKTGALFQVACVGGAILGEGSPAQRAAADAYARHLGYGFQMYDDLLPYLRDSATTGKSGDSDLANQRPTFPVLVGYEMAGRAQRDEIAAILRSRSADALARMSELLHGMGAIEQARQHAADEARLAIEALAGLPASESTDFLASVARLAVDRDR